jgi:hypothetical protein
MRSLSADQNGWLAPSVPAIGRVAAEESERTHILEAARNAILLPSGEIDSCGAACDIVKFESSG